MYKINEEVRQMTKDKIRGARFYVNNFGATVGGKYMPYSAFFKNAYINADKYIAEVQNRAWSLYGYAENNNLVNVFVTLTLPTEYHPLRGIYKNGKRIKTVKNKAWIDDEEHNPNNGSKQLTKMLKSLMDDRAYKKIPKDKRVYFRVTEPHKDGTPHLHISFFIPREFVDDFVSMIERKFPQPQSKIVTEVHNPVSYLMKYVLKTLDDLRGNEDNITDLTCWYVYWGINRFYTSRTLVSMNIYRVLGGRYTMLELTAMIKDKELSVWINPDTNKVTEIFDDGMLVYSRKPTEAIADYDSCRITPKMALKSMMNKDNIYIVPTEWDIENNERIVTPAYMGDAELYDYYHGLDINDEEVSPLHYAITENEMITRDMVSNIPMNNLNDYSVDIGF